MINTYTYMYAQINTYVRTHTHTPTGFTILAKEKITHFADLFQTCFPLCRWAPLAAPHLLPLYQPSFCPLLAFPPKTVEALYSCVLYGSGFVVLQHCMASSDSSQSGMRGGAATLTPLANEVVTSTLKPLCRESWSSDWSQPLTWITGQSELFVRS